ncbi:MAG: tetraacyldisaccharide 4'-kinase [Longimicrobiales bacterium]
MADPTADPGGAPAGLVERLWEGRLGPLGIVLGALLTPPELAFRGIVAARDVAYRTGLFRSHPAPVPAISVGNLTVGGTGKTPLVRWLVGELVTRGRTPGILHGGYSDDEPELHRRWFPELPVVATRDRMEAARSAVADGADVLVLDDAFQHRRIRRSLDVVLLAAESWTDRPRLLPRGPYREPLRALDRADVVVVTRRRAPAAAAADVARSVRGRTSVPVAVASLAPGGWLTPDGTPREGRPVRGVAVAGVGRPKAFFQQVADLGVSLTGTLAFRDHHPYHPADADGIRDAAGAAPVITTAKDAVKLETLLPDTDLWVLDQTVTFEEGREAVVEGFEEVTP